jgi:CubicO group peptidase (beta-lactamase class C family)
MSHYEDKTQYQFCTKTFATHVIALSQGSEDVFQCLPLKVSIKNSLEDGNIPGLVAIVINSTNILYEEAFGYNSPPISNERQPIDSRKTIFVLASISKTFIALAVMQLVELHHLDLDNDINQYLSPNMKVIHPFYSNISITLRHLLSHTSGIGPNFNEEIKHYVPNDDFIKTNLSDIIFSYINNKSNWLPDPPGTIVHYSNIGASLAALIVEQIAQISFEEYIRENILQPLGINKNHAGYRLSDFENRKKDLIKHYVFNSSWLEQAQNLVPQLNIIQVSC